MGVHVSKFLAQPIRRKLFMKHARMNTQRIRAGQRPIGYAKRSRPKLKAV
jgi:hypothetical protein